MTLDQAKQYLDSIGVSFPDFVIEAIIQQVTEKEECLRNNYSDNTVLLIYCYLIALIAGAQAGRYLSNRGLSGGLYQGFTYKESSALFGSQLSLLRSVDTKGCVADIIPEDPFKSKKGFMMSVRGSCYE